MITQQIKEKIDFSQFNVHFNRYLFLQNYKKYFKNKHVLDLACGLGYGSYLLVHNLEAGDVYGVDFDERAIKYAKKTFKENKLKFIRDNSSKFSQNRKFSNYFDVIVSFETIEHVENYKQFLLELKVLLKRNGYLFLSTPNKNSSSPYVKFPIYRFHLHEFTAKELRDILSKYFEILEFRYELLNETPLVKIRRIICFVASIIKLKITSRILELFFYMSKKIVNISGKKVFINKSTLVQLCLEEQNEDSFVLKNRGKAIGGFFIFAKNKN